MYMEYYRNFIQVVETGSISSAARKLFIAQPALSKQIKIIEKQYGAQLLQRGVKNISLTNAGQIFYEKAKLITSIEAIAQDEIYDCVLGKLGTLRLGFTPSYPDLFVEDILRDFSNLYPNIIYEIYEASSDKIMDLLKDSIIEVGLIRTPSYINPIFKSYRAVEEQLMAVFHKNNPWLSAEAECIPIKKLEGVPLSISRGFQEKVIEVCNDAGFSPTLLSVCSSRPTTVMWARQMKAVGLVTTTSFKILETDILCCRPLSGGDMSAKRSFAILKKHNLSTVAKSFLQFATNEATF